MYTYLDLHISMPTPKNHPVVVWPQKQKSLLRVRRVFFRKGQSPCLFWLPFWCRCGHQSWCLSSTFGWILWKKTAFWKARFPERLFFLVENIGNDPLYIKDLPLILTLYIFRGSIQLNGDDDKSLCIYIRIPIKASGMECLGEQL